MSNRNNRVVIKSFTQERLRSRRRRYKCISRFFRVQKWSNWPPAMHVLWAEERAARVAVITNQKGLRL